jgi:hypothetical protein
MNKPSVSIEATGDGLRWKVVANGETVASGAAESMEAAQAGADEIVARMGTEHVGP